MYLLNAEATIQWELLPTENPPALADLDILILSPYGDSAYTDSAIPAIDYTPPTDTTVGEVIYKITPQIEGLWRIRLCTGTSTNYKILSKVEMFVFDNATSTTPYNDTIGKPYPYDINFYLQGYLVPTEIYGIFVASRNITLATNAPGSEAVAEAFPAKHQTVLKIFHNDNEIGSITFPVLSKIGIIAVQPVVIIPGDKIQVVAQNTLMDSNIKDIAINLVGCCTVVPCSAI